MHVEDEGVEAVISFYLYGLIGLSLLVVISPLIIFAVPLLIVFGPVGFAWRRGHRNTPRVGALARWWLVAASLLVLALPVVPVLWHIMTSEDGAQPESFWMIFMGIVACPLALAATTYAIRMSRFQALDPPAGR